MKETKASRTTSRFALAFSLALMVGFVCAQAVWAYRALGNGTGKKGVYDELPASVELYRDKNGSLAQINAKNAEQVLEAENPYLSLSFDDEDYAKVVYHNQKYSGPLTKNHTYNGGDYYGITPDENSESRDWRLTLYKPHEFDTANPVGTWGFSLIIKGRRSDGENYSGGDYVGFAADGKAVYGSLGVSAIYATHGAQYGEEAVELDCTWTSFSSGDRTLYVFDYEGGRIVAAVRDH